MIELLHLTTVSEHLPLVIPLWVGKMVPAMVAEPSPEPIAGSAPGSSGHCMGSTDELCITVVPVTAGAGNIWWENMRHADFSVRINHAHQTNMVL